MALNETSIIDNQGPIKEVEINITITLPDNKGLMAIKIGASEAIRIANQIYGQIGEIGFVSRGSQAEYKKHFANQKKGTA